jgi:hypothetical protein
MDLSRFIYSSSESSIPRNLKPSFLPNNSSSSPQISSFLPPDNSSKSPSLEQSLHKKRKISSEPIIPDEKLGEGGLQELYATPGELELPLNLLIIGHNPSDASWKKGHYYANPSNRMWPLLVKSQLVPATYRSTQDSLCPFHCKIGFTDLILNFPETNSQKFTHEYLYSQRTSLYSRLIQHCQRVERNLRMNHQKISADDVVLTSHDLAAVPSEESTDFPDKYSPKIIAFSGIRQWKALFPLTSREFKQDYRTRYGIQKILPPDWPKELSKSVIFLLPTSSGAAPMTTAEREEPYLELARVMRSLGSSSADTIQEEERGEKQTNEIEIENEERDFNEERSDEEDWEAYRIQSEDVDDLLQIDRLT